MKMKRLFTLCIVLSISNHMLYSGQMDTAGDGAAPHPAEASDEVAEWSLVQGVDTAGDEGRGDWFKKKKILQQARKLYQDIHTLVQKIQQGQDAFKTATVVQIEQEIAAFKKIPVNTDLVTEKLKEFNDEIEAFAEKTTVNENQRASLVALQDTKNSLQQFTVDLTFAQELVQGLEQSVAIAATETQKCVLYEKKAWALYESIDAALNDVAAEQMFLEMQSMAENIGLIGNYLANDLFSYVTKSVDLLHQQVAKLEEEIVQLQEANVFERPQTEEERLAALQVAKPAPAPQPSWWQVIVSPFVWLWDWIMSFFHKSASK